jgi:hypothetical protein
MITGRTRIYRALAQRERGEKQSDQTRNARVHERTPSQKAAAQIVLCRPCQNIKGPIAALAEGPSLPSDNSLRADIDAPPCRPAMSANWAHLRIVKSERNASSGRQANEAYRVCEHLTEAEMTLAQDQEPRGASSEARGGGRQAMGARATTAQRVRA